MSVETERAAPRAERVDQVEALARLGDRLGSASTMLDVFRAVHGEASRILAMPVFFLGLYDDTSRMIEVVRQIDHGEELPGGSFPLGQGFTSQAIRERRPVLISQWSRSGPAITVLYGTESGRLVRPESSITVPLISRERVVGVISAQSYDSQAYGEADLAFLSAVGSVTARVVDEIAGAGTRDPDLIRRVSELEAILASMTDALVIVDANGALRRMNREARELLALAPDTIVMGQPVLAEDAPDRWPFGAKEMAASLAKMFERLRGGESICDVEVEVRVGPLRMLSLSGAPLTDPDGSFAGAVIIFRDVTSRREVERLKDEMLSAAWHDLRTPITAIKGEAQLLRRRLARAGDDRDDLRRGLEMMDRQADRLHELVDTLLDASGIQLGRLQIERVPTDLVTIVTSVAESMRTSTSVHDVRIEAPSRCVGLWDGRRLRQVIENLVGNALKYSPAGGTVRVAVRPEAGAVTISVSDDGIGLTQEETERVFERGYRADRALSQKGSGLGLYISHAIVTVHGGRIWARSDGPGRGSTFAFTLPAGTIDV